MIVPNEKRKNLDLRRNRTLGFILKFPILTVDVSFFYEKRVIITYEDKEIAVW